MVPLTRNEIAHLLAAAPLPAPTRQDIDSAGQRGDDDTSTPPSDATTSGDRRQRYDKSRTSAGVLEASLDCSCQSTQALSCGAHVTDPIGRVSRILYVLNTSHDIRVKALEQSECLKQLVDVRRQL